MENILLPIIVAVISSGGMTALVTTLLNRISKGDPTKIALRLLLQDKLEFLCLKYLDQGSISYTKKKFLKSCYRCYKSLGGNGDMEDLMALVDKLEITNG